MTAKDLDSGDKNKQELYDTTTCCICTEIYTNPKALPCIHTFCMKCLQENGLKTNKEPGDEMPCPICRRLFKIPPEGFHGLPKNFFIEKLVQVANVLDQPVSSRSLCDACLEENEEESGKDIHTADTYCVDCNQKFCGECSRQHRKFKLTKHHKLIPMNEHDIAHNSMTDLAPSVCELHRQRVMDVYCTDCKTVVCAICFIEEHKSHDGSHVDKRLDEFRKQIQNNTEALNECIVQAEVKKAKLQKMKEATQERVEKLECDVTNSKDELKRLIDEHEASLLQGLYFIRQSKLKEIQMATDDVDTYLSSLETYNSYCQKIMAKGSASDICCAFLDLSARAMELQQQCQPMMEREIQSINFRLRKSELEEFLEESCNNLIGEIEEEGDLKPKKRSKQSLLAEQSNEIDILIKENEIEKTEKESFRWANEQLKLNVAKKAQANKSMTEELNKEKANYDAHIKKLKQELDNKSLSNDTLQTNNNKLKQELDARIVTSNSLQTNNDKLKQELQKEKVTNSTLQSNNDKLKQEMDAMNLTNSSLQTNNYKVKQELQKEKMTNSTLQSNNDKLKQELDAMNLTNSSLQTINDKLKQELDKERIANSSLQANNRKMEQELDKERMDKHFLQARNSKRVQEVNTYEMTIRTLEDKTGKLKQELETTKSDCRKKILNLEEKLKQEQNEREQLVIMQTEEKKRLLAKLRYKSDPVLVKTIRTNDAEAKSKMICGLTILDKDLFILSEKSSEVEAYDSIKLSFSRRWILKELIHPVDIESCKQNKCLYILDFKGDGQSSDILRVSPNGKLIKNWSIGDDGGYGLSITDEMNVILTVFNKNKLSEYSPEGQIIREIDLSVAAGICHPRHAVKLTNGHFMVSHGRYGDDRHRVCLVDADGKLKKTFSGENVSVIGQMNLPVHLSVDKNGFVMVVDRWKSRVLLLDSDLEYKAEILSKKQKHGLRYPSRILLDESNGRLFVADNELNSDGRILIFDF